MKIYTKTGDKGLTTLDSGKKVSKSNTQVELYGTCDELNSSIGLSISFLKPDSILKKKLLNIQNILFELGSELAGYKPKDSLVSILTQTDIEYLEKNIDSLEVTLSPLKSFILPSGTSASAFLHVSRTICRRLERLMVREKENGLEIFDEALVYVNRLSDFLFVAARTANSESNIEDIVWKSRARQ